eukprot:m.255872 g.255872  ORF g.255872 m.255872 type:complete len:62 (+) comp15510_c1_seq1:259-444(+)
MQFVLGTEEKPLGLRDQECASKTFQAHNNRNDRRQEGKEELEAAALIHQLQTHLGVEKEAT